MTVPELWRDFPCADYFESPICQTGWWDADGQCWYIEPAERLHEDEGREMLVIGHPGVDGIEWGYRRGVPGLWAWFPSSCEFVRIASSVADLRDGHASGRISV